MGKNKFLKLTLYSISFLMVFLFNLESVFALQGKTTANLKLRKEATTSSTHLLTISSGTTIDIVKNVSGNASGCPSGTWYQTTYNKTSGYVCADYVTLISNVSPGEYGEVKGEGVKIHYSPGSANFSFKLYTSHNDPAFYINKYLDSGNGCSGKWAHVTYIRTNGQVVYGYICSTYIKTATKEPLGPNPYIEESTENEFSKMTDAQFDAYLTAQGFNEAYKSKLKAIHKLHPSWVFVGKKTNYTLDYVVEKENNTSNSKSLVQNLNRANDGYLETDDISYNWYTNTFRSKDSGGWYNANRQTIKYYMNPLNWLNERHIFYFEDEKYYPEIHTLATVENILSGTQMLKYANHFMTAAQSSGISPIQLATLARQEIGTGLGPAISGTAKAPATCSDPNVKNVDFSGYYNFYNIGASSGDCAVYRGLAVAKSKEWTSPEIAIVGGAEWKTTSYTRRGQTTPYYQKWDLFTPFVFQYMQNIAGQIYPAERAFTSYSNSGKLEVAKTFTIPIYNNLTATSSLPNKGNPNNWLNSLKINGIEVPSFDGAKTSYTVNIASNATSVSVSASAVASTSKINGTGTVSITSSTKSISVKVTAANGSVKTYTINLTRGSDPTVPPTDPEDNTPPTANIEIITKAGFKHKNNLVYGFTLGSSASSIKEKLSAQNSKANITVSGNGTGSTIKITNDGTTDTYTMIIYGDGNGDGVINTLDIVTVQRDLLNISKLKGIYFEAMDSNKDGKINTLDIVMIQRHLLNISKMPQK